MKQIISFSLGNLWKWMKTNNRVELLKYTRKLDISGVEIIFYPPMQIDSFKMSKDDISYLKGLKYVTLHPIKPRIMPLQEYELWLKKVFEIYHESNAKAFILHPKELQNPEIKIKGMKLLTETMSPHYGMNNEELKRIINKYKAGLCLDVSHVYKYSKYETDNVIKKFKKDIKQVHFSGNYRRKDHVSLQSVSKDFLYSIRNIKHLNVPIVIEEEFNTKNINEIKKEIEYIKTLV